MKDEKFRTPTEERNVKIRVTRLSNGFYEFPHGFGPEVPIAPDLFRDLERSGEIHWKTHEVDERPYRRARFQQHLSDRLAEIVTAKHNDIELKD